MKKIIFLVLISCGAFHNSLAQDIHKGGLRKNILKLNTLSTALGQPMLSYEYSCGHKWSLQGSYGYSSSRFKNDSLRSNGRMMEFTLEAKVYTGHFRNGPEGFYVSGFFSVVLIDEKETYVRQPEPQYRLNTTAAFVGPATGYQWERRNLMLDVYYGWGIEVFSSETTLDESAVLDNNYLFSSALHMRYGVSLGYRF